MTGDEKDISEFIKNPPVEPETKPSSDNQKYSSKKCPITGQYHYYGETASFSDDCDGWSYYYIINNGNGSYSMMGDDSACQYAINYGFAPNQGDEASGLIWLG